MNKKFIPHEEALALEELGFDEPCFAKYEKDGLFQLFHTIEIAAYLTINSNGVNGIVCAPLYQQAFRWFREKYKLHSYIYGDYSWNISGGIWDLNGYKDSRYDWDSEPYKTYEEAELECLKELIKIVKEKKP